LLCRDEERRRRRGRRREGEREGREKRVQEADGLLAALEEGVVDE